MRFFKNKRHSKTVYIAALLISGLLCACSGDEPGTIGSVNVSEAASTLTGTSVLVPAAPGQHTDGNKVFSLDYSNTKDGYIVAEYLGSSTKIKLQLTGPNNTTYTYNLTPFKQTVVPLTTGSGAYTLNLFESISNDQYSTAFSTVISAENINEFSPFLYPNQYVNFNPDSKIVKEASSLSSGLTCDLELIAKIYAFLVENVVYDYDEAKTVASDYLPDVDEVLETKKGICFDYAALMASMLRSQGIPARMEIGYAKDAYHAWISVYTKDKGWIDKMMEFDGSTWTLMDPTLAANTKDADKIEDFVGDGKSYSVKYMY